jgi:hypothetical protein
MARFQWLAPARRQFTVQQSSLNAIRVRFSAGPAASFLWADTRYPGWQFTLDGKRVPSRPYANIFTEIAVPTDGGELMLRYQPRFLRIGQAFAASALAVLLGLGFRRKRSNTDSPPNGDRKFKAGERQGHLFSP